MGIFSKFENKMEDAIDELGDKLFDSPISPVQIAKKAEKQMRRNKMLGAGKQYAPTLYTVLVNPSDDARLFGYYPTLAGETETYLKAKANEAGFVMDGDPLVRFIVDEELKSGKFDVIAEAVASEIINQLRQEEIQRYNENSNNAKVPDFVQNNNASNIPVNNNESQPFATPNANNPATASYNPSVSAANQGAQVPTPNVVPQPVPVPTPNVVPQPVPVPNPTPAVANNKNDENLSSAKTTMFSAGFDISQTEQQNNSVAVQAILCDINTGAVHNLTLSTNVLGRENTCNIVLSDANASRQHAQISYNNGAWFINDLGSTNGTFVNNQEITTRQINEGDIITIGVTKLRFSISN